MKFLHVDRLTKSFGGINAVKCLKFSVNEGEITAVIGPNGAGKTTLFNLVTGVIKPDAGQAEFKEQVITGLAPEQIAQLGITRTFQNLQLFTNMSVLENVMVGAYRHGRLGLIKTGLRWPGMVEEEQKIYRLAEEMLELVGLAEKKSLPVDVLPYGEQRLVEIARALALKPELLLLDEPAAGLNREEALQLGKLIVQLPAKGITVLLVEHNMDMVMNVAQRIIVMDYGTKLAEGTPADIRNNPRVIAAYLGEEV